MTWGIIQHRFLSRFHLPWLSSYLTAPAFQYLLLFSTSFPWSLNVSVSQGSVLSPLSTFIPSMISLNLIALNIIYTLTTHNFVSPAQTAPQNFTFTQQRGDVTTCQSIKWSQTNISRTKFLIIHPPKPTPAFLLSINGNSILPDQKLFRSKACKSSLTPFILSQLHSLH